MNEHRTTTAATTDSAAPCAAMRSVAATITPRTRKHAAPRNASQVAPTPRTREQAILGTLQDEAAPITRKQTALRTASQAAPRARFNSRALVFGVAAVLLPAAAFAAEAGIPALTVQGANGTQTYTLTVQILLLMTALTLLPAILLMMTAFTRIVIVLGILRQAIGAGQTPPNQVLIGLSLFLTFFVMSPVIEKIQQEAVKPYLAGNIDSQVALQKATGPLKGFMLMQTRESDIATFVRISGGQGYATPEDVPMSVLVPAFVTSELKTAFLIGFLIFIPFVIIDLVVASVLMSMGMMMLSPVLISLPFKLMLFVLVDGWSLVMGTLAASFYQ
jgi:flagellar biosynthesis protein FliP